MATTTFSGPIKAGTISNTTGTTVGDDVKNTGQVLMSQTFSFDYTVEATATDTNVVIPANSQIVRIDVNVETDGGSLFILPAKTVVEGEYEVASN